MAEIATFRTIVSLGSREYHVITNGHMIRPPRKPKINTVNILKIYNSGLLSFIWSCKEKQSKQQNVIFAWF